MTRRIRSTAYIRVRLDVARGMQENVRGRQASIELSSLLRSLVWEELREPCEVFKANNSPSLPSFSLSLPRLEISTLNLLCFVPQAYSFSSKSPPFFYSFRIRLEFPLPILLLFAKIDRRRPGRFPDRGYFLLVREKTINRNTK